MRRPAIALSLAALCGCATNPVTGEKQLALVSENQEIAMGQQAAKQVADSIGLYPDPKLEAYVSSIGKTLAATSQRPNLPWQFHVVDDATVNAFALPGGPVFVTRGLVSYVDNEAELAGVIGHEIGHVNARHSVSQISRAELAQLGLGLGMIFSPQLQKYGQLAGAGLQLMMLRYSRDAEREADGLGFDYALQHNYDVRQMTSLFQMLSSVSQAQSGGKLPQWLETHPDPKERVADNQARIEKLHRDLTGAVVNRDKHLETINGMVFGDNPRQGFFRGNAFLHPDLKFQVTFPQGWKTQNLPQLVGAVSPTQDAAVVLAPGEPQPPEAALRAFLSQQGVQAGTPSAAAIHGLPAASSTFTAATDQGNIDGIVSFLSYGGKTYQMLGYAKQGGLAPFEAPIRATFDSFSALTDPSALNVQPAHLEIVTVPGEMTLEQFMARYPSAAPATQIATINGIPQGGSFKAGQRAKRVVGGPTAAP